MKPLSSDLPASVTIVDITDPAGVGEGTELMTIDAVLIQATPFRARRVIVRTEAATLVFNSTNHALRSRSKTHPAAIAYAVAGPRAQGSVNGIPIRPGFMLAVGPGVEYSVVVNAEWETTTFLLPPDFLHSHLTSRRLDSEFSVPHGVELLQASPAASLNLFNWGKQLAETAAAQASSFNDQQDLLLAIQCEMVEHLLATLGTTKELKFNAGDLAMRRRHDIVKLAEDYADAQNGVNVYVSDLCRVAGVGERTLEYAFKDVTGLTPMAFLNRLRHHRVRKRLLIAAPGSTTVAQEAAKWGFWHFGEFAKDYKKIFGELPSDTLMRANVY